MVQSPIFTFHFSICNSELVDSTLQVEQLNSFSLQRSEMFIATQAPKDLAPLRAKPGSGIFTGAGKNDCAPTELRPKERTAKL